MWDTGLLTSRDDWGENSWRESGPVESRGPLLRVPGWKTPIWSKNPWGDLPQDFKGMTPPQYRNALRLLSKVEYLFPFSVFDLQVEYSYPSQATISAGAKDLVARLLKHNPMHRLPIQGVLSHPWVVEYSTKKPTTLNGDEPSQWLVSMYDRTSDGDCTR